MSHTGTATTRAGGAGFRFLPPEDCRNGEYPYACHSLGSSTNAHGMTAAWREVADGDHLYIGAHGGAKDSSQVAWKTDGGVVWWTAAQVALALRVNFWPDRAPRLDYHLYACFGANSYFKTGECFGVRLQREMRVHGLRGRLTAYNGAVGLNASGGHQTGSSRVTCAFWYGVGRKHHDSGATASMGKTFDLLA